MTAPASPSNGPDATVAQVGAVQAPDHEEQRNVMHKDHFSEEFKQTITVFFEETIIHTVALCLLLGAMRFIEYLLVVLGFEHRMLWGKLPIHFLIDTFDFAALSVSLGSLVYQLFKRLRKLGD